MVHANHATVADDLKNALQSILGSHIATLPNQPPGTGCPVPDWFLLDFSTVRAISLEIHLRDQRCRPIVALHIRSPTRPEDPDRALRACMETPGLVEICQINAPLVRDCLAPPGKTVGHA